MAGDCTGSRVGAGCDFVQGSIQRTALLSGVRNGQAQRGTQAGLNAESVADAESFSEVGSATEPADAETGSTYEDSIDAKIKAYVRAGDYDGLRNLLDAASPQQVRTIQAGLTRLESTASQIISKELRGSVNRVFPAEMRDKTLAEINRLAREGNEAARTARKLLQDSRFKK